MTSLIWKEWHEQRWKLAFGSLILAAFALIGLRTRVVADETLLLWVCLLGILLLPVLVSMGLFPAERQAGTLESLLALPVSARRIFLVKTLIGILLCAGPLAVAGGVSLLTAGGRELRPAEMIELYARSTAASVLLFMWMLALTVRLPGEARAGLLAMGVLIFWLLGTAPLLTMTGNESGPLSSWHAAPWLVSPFFFTVGFHSQAIAKVSAWLALAIQSVIAAALWLWAARRVAAEETV